MLQFLKSQINRFEGHQKGKRKNLLNKDLIPLVESFLTKNRTSNDYLFLNRKTIKDGDGHFFKLLEEFSKEDKSTYNFPTQSL